MRSMTLAAAIVAGLMTLQPALAQKANPLVTRAIEAQGGEAALRALKGLTIEGDSKHWEPEQSKAPGGEPRFLGDSTVATVWDLGKGAVRTTWDRDMKYPALERLRFTEIVTPAGGAVITDNKPAPMSAIRVATALREMTRIDPTLMLKLADNPGKVKASGAEKLGSASMQTVTYTDGAIKLRVLFDPTTRLPAAIRSTDDDNIEGDSRFDVQFSDWRSVGGVKLAHVLTYRLNGVEVGKVNYKSVAANPSIAPDVLAIPGAVAGAAKGPAAGTVPYQWVIRRLWLGRFVDSDLVYAAANGGLKLVELAPNVQQVLGGSHNNLIVAMRDGLVVFDAPIGEAQSLWVIDAAKKKYPGKPIKYVVLTHHHMDHTGGTRTYLAEGATLVVPAPVKAHFERMMARPRTVAPDRQQTARKPVRIIEVKDTHTIKDAGGEIQLYNIPNPHADGMLLGHVVGDNVVWVTDLYSPVRDTARTAGSQAVIDALKKIGIKDATIAGGHGANGKQAVLEALIASR